MLHSIKKKTWCYWDTAYIISSTLNISETVQHRGCMWLKPRKQKILHFFYESTDALWTSCLKKYLFFNVILWEVIYSFVPWCSNRGHLFEIWQTGTFFMYLIWFYILNNNFISDYLPNIIMDHQSREQLCRVSYVVNICSVGKLTTIYWKYILNHIITFDYLECI